MLLKKHLAIQIFTNFRDFRTWLHDGAPNHGCIFSHASNKHVSQCSRFRIVKIGSQTAENERVLSLIWPCQNEAQTRPWLHDGAPNHGCVFSHASNKHGSQCSRFRIVKIGSQTAENGCTEVYPLTKVTGKMLLEEHLRWPTHGGRMQPPPPTLARHTSALHPWLGPPWVEKNHGRPS